MVYRSVCLHLSGTLMEPGLRGGFIRCRTFAFVLQGESFQIFSSRSLPQEIFDLSVQVASYIQRLAISIRR